MNAHDFTKTFQLPPTVNFHLWKPCNLQCRFCFATFNDDPLLKNVKGGMKEPHARRILELLSESGVEKITFVGGEPTLCPYLPALLKYARELNLVTSLVTNGARLTKVLGEAPGCLDWVGLSVDSANEETQAALWRGSGNHVAQSYTHFQTLHNLGIRVKLNTVVTSMNWQEDMSDFVLQVKPDRWKIFQVLPVFGQNNEKVKPLLISAEQFNAFVERHRWLSGMGITMAPESNEDMTGSYAMIDPLGRFFCNVTGTHEYSRPILEVGVHAAFQDISFDHSRFIARGGFYDWSALDARLKA